MKRKWLFLLLAIFLLFGCEQTNTKTKIEKPTDDAIEIDKKQGIDPPLSDEPFLHSIKTDRYSFVEVSEWYDEDTLLYVKEENGQSYVQKFNIKTGEEQEFFQLDESIIEIKASKEQQYYAIQVASFAESPPIYIVDRAGDIRYQLADIGEDHSVFWSNDQPGKLIIVTYFPNWDFIIFLLDVEEGHLKELDIEHTYVQWLDKESVAYLDWDVLEPSYAAPLYRYDLKTGNHLHMFDDIIAFFTFSNQHMMTVTTDAFDALNSVFTFYQGEKRVGTTEVPILSTYSDQWWIPFHAFDAKRQLFYYLKPYYSGTFIDYEDNFQLVVFSLVTGEEKKIADVPVHAPMLLSPGGDLLLFGHQLEQVIDLRNSGIHVLPMFMSDQ